MTTNFEGVPGSLNEWYRKIDRIVEPPVPGSISRGEPGEWTRFLPLISGNDGPTLANLPVLNPESSHTPPPIHNQMEQPTAGDESSYMLMASRTDDPETGEIRWVRVRRDLTPTQNAKERFGNRVFALGCLSFVGLAVTAVGVIRWIAE